MNKLSNFINEAIDKNDIFATYVKNGFDKSNISIKNINGARHIVFKNQVKNMMLARKIAGKYDIPFAMVADIGFTIHPFDSFAKMDGVGGDTTKFYNELVIK